MAKIAVLIPVYNDPAGLQLSLGSLEDEPADVFVVDDGSSPPIKADSVNLVRLSKHGGITKALNVGMLRLYREGYDYVARLDAGDTSRPGRIAAQASFLDVHKNHAVVGCSVAHITPNGALLFVNRPPTDHGAMARVMRRRNGLDHPSVMMRASALADVTDGVETYDPRHCGSEDYELWRRLLRAGWEIGSLVAIYVDKEVKDSQITARPFRSWPRFKVQLRYFEPFSLNAWLGIARTILALMTSRRFVLMAKRWRHRWCPSRPHEPERPDPHGDPMRQLTPCPKTDRDLKLP